MSPIEQHLQTHSRALHALARDLVGDQHANDLLQDTAVQALAAPPRRAGPLGGWLFSLRSGTIRLTLREAAGQPAANCVVLAKNGTGEVVRRGTTDAQGRLDLPVPVGVLQLSWQRTTQGVDGLPTVSLGSVAVGQGETVNVERTLSPGTAR